MMEMSMIPASAAAAHSPQLWQCGVPRPRSHAVHTAHILVIDEDPAILDLIRELLEGEGFQVSTRCRAEPDVRDVRALAPDVIVLDSPWLWRPEIAAWLPVNALRLDRATRNIPIVLCTGNRETVQCATELEARGLKVIAKPFDITGFVAVIRAALGARDSRTTPSNVTDGTPGTDLLA